MKLAAAILLTGSALFQVGALLPVSRFYVSSPEEKLTIMQEHPAQWLLRLAGMGFGSLIAAVGLALLVLRFPTRVPSALGTAASVAVAVAAGTLLWLWHLLLRVADPVGFATGSNPFWQFIGYTALMQVGLPLLAAAFHTAAFPRWMVLVFAGGTALTILALAVIRDVPPFAHYIWLLAVGIGLSLMADPIGPRSDGRQLSVLSTPAAPDPGTDAQVAGAGGAR